MWTYGTWAWVLVSGNFERRITADLRTQITLHCMAAGMPDTAVADVLRLAERWVWYGSDGVIAWVAPEDSGASMKGTCDRAGQVRVFDMVRMGYFDGYTLQRGVLPRGVVPVATTPSTSGTVHLFDVTHPPFCPWQRRLMHGLRYWLHTPIREIVRDYRHARP